MARKYLHHTMDVYGVEVFATCTPKGWQQLRKRLGGLLDDAEPPQSAGQAQFGTWHPNGPGLHVPHLVLWVDVASHPTAGDLVDTVAHEASHGAGQILEHIGHDPAGTDEPHAYLVGWLTRWLWEYVEPVRAAGQPTA